MATSLSYVIVILDTSIVNVALPPIAADLGTGLSGLQWVVNAYTLAFASLLLSGGTLGDRLGDGKSTLPGWRSLPALLPFAGWRGHYPYWSPPEYCKALGPLCWCPVP